MSIVFSPACHQCGNFTENIDGCVCKAAAYCSELCKSAHWETSHQDLCPGRESNTTYARGCELLKNAALIILKNSSLPRERVVELYKDNVVRCIGGKEIAHLGTVPTYYQRNKAEERGKPPTPPASPTETSAPRAHQICMQKFEAEMQRQVKHQPEDAVIFGYHPRYDKEVTEDDLKREFAVLIYKIV